MKAYLDLLKEIIDDGVDKPNRTGMGARSLFGRQLHFNLQEGFPLLTTKKLHLKSIIHELLWFIKGDTNIAYLKEHGVRIWDEWANEKGELGPIYGKQWRDFGGVDQLKEVLRLLKKEPYSRRIILSTWNPPELKKMALSPCHVFFQFFVEPEKDGTKSLSCQLYQRSADCFLGVPFNIASYCLLTHMIAKIVGMKAKKFVLALGDVHLYHNHFEVAKLQLSREPKKTKAKLVLSSEPKTLFEFKFEHISIENYEAHPPIKAQVSI